MGILEKLDSKDSAEQYFKSCLLSTDPVDQDTAKEGIRKLTDLIFWPKKNPINFYSSPQTLSDRLLKGVNSRTSSIRLPGRSNLKITSDDNAFIKEYVQKSIKTSLNKLMRSQGLDPRDHRGRSPEFVTPILNLFNAVYRATLQTFNLANHSCLGNLSVVDLCGQIHKMTSHDIKISSCQDPLLHSFVELTNISGPIWKSGSISQDWIILDNPQYIAFNKDYRFHCDDGPALVYRDGYEVYALNGVTVPKLIVETPAEDLDPKLIASETNAEVRKEIVKKIGIEKVCTKLATVVESRMPYVLMNLSFDGRYRPYLRMDNPSTDEIHFEGVHPRCRTIDEALTWRNGTPIPPKILT